MTEGVIILLMLSLLVAATITQDRGHYFPAGLLTGGALFMAFLLGTHANAWTTAW